MNPRTAWIVLSACGSAEPELFETSVPSKARNLAAKEICFSCPVRMRCLEDAIDFEARSKGPQATGVHRDDIEGIVGGLHPNERLPIVNARRLELLRAGKLKEVAA